MLKHFYFFGQIEMGPEICLVHQCLILNISIWKSITKKGNAVDTAQRSHLPESRVSDSHAPHKYVRANQKPLTREDERSVTKVKDKWRNMCGDAKMRLRNTGGRLRRLATTCTIISDSNRYSGST